MPAKFRTRLEGRQHHAELVQDGETVSRLIVLDLPIRILGVPIRMGGIAGVATPPEHRMKGHARRLLQETVRYMTGLGQEVSMLFGIPDFYDKFGFLPCLPEYCMRLATRDAERSLEGIGDYRTRPIREDDYPFTVRLYNDDNRHRTAAVIRDRGTFAGFQMGSGYWIKAAGFILEGRDGDRIAYAAFDDSPTEVSVIEVNATDRRAFWNLLHEFAKMAIERRTGQLEFYMACDHPFVRFARRYGCRMETRYPRKESGMMRLLDQSSLFQKLRPALRRRLEQSEFAGRRVRLTIETDLGTADLRFNPGRGDSPAASGAIRLGQDKLIQLIVGYRAADDVLADPGVEAEGDAQALLDALFGRQEPYVWRADRF